MSDLIDRKAILKKIDNIRHGVQMMDDTHRASIVMTGMHLCEEAVRNQPSAEPERKKGRWEHIYIKRRGYTYDDRTPRTRESAYCTACRAIVPELKKISRGDSKYRTICNVFNFCPNCGADMRGGEDETD